MLQKVTRLDSVPTAEETVLTTDVPTKESRLYTLLLKIDFNNSIITVASGQLVTSEQTSMRNRPKHSHGKSFVILSYQ